jgi:hypothetical protein
MSDDSTKVVVVNSKLHGTFPRLEHVAYHVIHRLIIGENYGSELEDADFCKAEAFFFFCMRS